jgi:predicted metalloprotease
MTFNDNADIGGGKTSRRGRTGLIVGGGGGGLLVIALFVISQLTGFNVNGLVDGVGSGGGNESVDTLGRCQTGADANANLDCRMKGAAASLDVYWNTEYPKLTGQAYASPQPLALFDGGTNTGCGAASSATGPFYCPPDQTMYVDTAFFSELRDRFGASGGPLAEMYVVAHEWGHHIQNLAGVISQSSDGDTGPGSNSIRIELQADCFAGAWAGAASSTKDESGTPFLKPITQAEIQDALSAASAVGDDRIQGAGGGQVRPDTWTHGSSEQRQKWFLAGFERGAESCDTFGVGAPDL